MARPRRDPLQVLRRAEELCDLAGDERAIGYLGRVFTQTSLPYRNPGNVPVWGRRNGNLLVTLQPKHYLDENGEAVSVGYPYGTIPRLLLSYVTSAAVRRNSPELELGHSLTSFMKDLGMAATGGKNGTITRLRDQARRLFEANLSVRWDLGADRDKGRNLVIATSWDLQWGSAEAGQESLFPSQIRLSEEFFQEITERPVPQDMAALRFLRGSAMRLDQYAWLTHRMSYLSKPTVVPWESLMGQFGSQMKMTSAGLWKFKQDFTTNLAHVLLIYPDARVEVTDAGLLLKPSLTHVPFAGTAGLRAAKAAGKA